MRSELGAELLGKVWSNDDRFEKPHHRLVSAEPEQRLGITRANPIGIRRPTLAGLDESVEHRFELSGASFDRTRANSGNGEIRPNREYVFVVIRESGSFEEGRGLLQRG